MKLTALLTAALVAFAPLHATPLSDLIESHGLTWMVGSWSAADGKVKISYEWRQNKHALGVTFSAGERSAEGMIVLKPGTDKSHYGAVDSEGAVSRGEWIEHNGNPALKATRTTAEGELKTLSEHIRVDDRTMKVRVHKQDDSGGAGELMVELEFTKQ